MKLFLSTTPSPIGDILLVTDGTALCASEFADHEDRLHRLLRRYHGGCSLIDDPDPHAFTQPLQAYFAGDLAALDAIPVAPGGSEFQSTVWSALRRIPVGSTMTYGGLAASLGRPAASRAVGLANGANPVSIVVPCHRLVGANGSLTGYGGGIERKAWLLRHEGAEFRGTSAHSSDHR